jgi:hypothetical protein
MSRQGEDTKCTGNGEEDRKCRSESAPPKRDRLCVARARRPRAIRDSHVPATAGYRFRASANTGRLHAAPPRVASSTLSPARSDSSRHLLVVCICVTSTKWRTRSVRWDAAAGLPRAIWLWDSAIQMGVTSTAPENRSNFARRHPPVWDRAQPPATHKMRPPFRTAAF